MRKMLEDLIEIKWGKKCCIYLFGPGGVLRNNAGATAPVSCLKLGCCNSDILSWLKLSDETVWKKIKLLVTKFFKKEKNDLCPFIEKQYRICFKHLLNIIYGDVAFVPNSGCCINSLHFRTFLHPTLNLLYT